MLTGFVTFPGSDFISNAHKRINDPIPQLTGYLELFQSIINKLLAKDPAERFASVGEMFLALDRLSQHIAKATNFEQCGCLSGRKEDDFARRPIRNPSDYSSASDGLLK